jgi:peptidoglycan/LPS O-acetylase OafA/YrhL
MVIDHYECPNSKTKPSASTGQLPSLTSLRGLAALWVVLYHYCVQCFPNLDVAHYTQLIGKGYLAVDMFFMLSGFVMTHVYYRAFSDSNGIMLHYRGFLVARIARLYPLHIFMLLLFVATAVTSQLMAGSVTSPLQSIPLKGPESVTAFLANIFMLQGLEAGKLSWNYPSWSISVEFMAYLAFPLALPLVWRAPHPVKFVLGLLLFCALGWLAFLKKGDFDQWDGPIALLRCLPEFLLAQRRRRSHLHRRGHDSVFAFRRARSADCRTFCSAHSSRGRQRRAFRQSHQRRAFDLARRNLLFALPYSRLCSVRRQKDPGRVRNPA